MSCWSRRIEGSCSVRASRRPVRIRASSTRLTARTRRRAIPTTRRMTAQSDTSLSSVQKVLQMPDLRQCEKLFLRPLLHLPDPLPREPESVSHLLERHGLSPPETVPSLDDHSFPGTAPPPS